MSKYKLKNSIWYETAPRTSYPKLQESIDADVVIVGGGLAGLHSAYSLLEAGRKPVILERHSISVWASGSAMSKVASSHSFLFGSINQWHGREAAAYYGAANIAGFNRIKELIDKYKIKCDWAPADNYVFASAPRRVARLKQELDTFSDVGMDVVWEDKIPRDINPFENWGGIRQRNQAVYHPRKFALALGQAVADKGGVIYEKSLVKDMKRGKDGRFVLSVGDFEVRAKDVVIATKWPPKFFETFNDVINEWSAHIFAFKVDDIKFKDSFYGFRKTVSSYRQHHDKDTGVKYAMVSGKNPGYVRHLFGWGEMPEYAWQCEDTESIDYLPLIGEAEKNLYMALGFNGWGMTTSAYAGMLIAQCLTGDGALQEHLDAASLELGKEFHGKLSGKKLEKLVSPMSKDRHAIWEERLKTMPKTEETKHKKLWAAQ